jgi:hypothetical protein
MLGVVVVVAMFIVELSDSFTVEDDAETIDDVGVCINWFVLRNFTANGFPP